MTDDRHHIHMPAQDDATVYCRADAAVDGFLGARFVGHGLVGYAVASKVLFDPIGDGKVAFAAEDGKGD